MTRNMVDPSVLKEINRQLKDRFGYGPDGINPTWRVMWANDLLEKRWVQHTDEGWELLFPEVRERRKYQNIIDRYVLERQVPVVGETDVTTPVSYEPVWTFEDRHGEYLPPRLDACIVIIDTIYMQQDKAGFYKKYDDPDATPEARLQKVLNMEQILFGNETPVGDHLAHKSGITVPEIPAHDEQREA